MLGMECSWIKPQPTEEQDYIIIVWTARECHFSVYFVRISLSQLPIYISFMPYKTPECRLNHLQCAKYYYS